MFETRAKEKQILRENLLCSANKLRGLSIIFNDFLTDLESCKCESLMECKYAFSTLRPTASAIITLINSIHDDMKNLGVYSDEGGA